MTIRDRSGKLDPAVLLADTGSGPGGGRCLWSNERAAGLLGYSRSELAGLPLGDLFPPEEMVGLARLLEEKLTADRSVVETSLLTRDSRDIPLEGRLYAIDLPDRTITMIILREVEETDEEEAGQPWSGREVSDQQRLLEENIRGAAIIQQSLLPQSPPDVGQTEIAWKFAPSQVVGGDVFNIFRLDEKHLGLYILDVSGHGVASAMVTVSVSQMLRPNIGQLLKRKTPDKPYYEIVAPDKVLTALDGEYPLERFDKFFSMVYLVLNIEDGRLSYCNGGHPPPLVLRRGKGLELLKHCGVPVGLGGLVPFGTELETLGDGDRLILYTDGVIEHRNRQGEFFGFDHLCDLSQSLRRRPLQSMLDQLLDDVLDFGGRAAPDDDVSLIGIDFKTGR
ncbi:MAG: SpoIIE family protein phosphatase [Deltaproteobacteria bacterium]|nr:SpoIIE family protein phosphatase [Deltaproteobacteria bacterium]